MRRLNPIILDVLYRVGAYPFDDIQLRESDGRPANVWVITKTPLPVFIAIHGNGTSVSALIAELHRLQKSLSKHHGLSPNGEWAYWITAHCENTHSRIVNREMQRMDSGEVAVGLNSYAFIPWFDPPEEAEPVYVPGAVFSTELLPASELEMDDEGLYTSRDWEDALDDPDSMDRDFAKSLGLDIDEHGGGSVATSFDDDMPEFEQDEFEQEEEEVPGLVSDRSDQADSGELASLDDHDPRHDPRHDPDHDDTEEDPDQDAEIEAAHGEEDP